MEDLATINTNGNMFFKKLFRDIVGEKVRILSNTKCLVISNEKTSYETIIKDLRLLLKDINLKNDTGAEKIE